METSSIGHGWSLIWNRHISCKCKLNTFDGLQWLTMQYDHFEISPLSFCSSLIRVLFGQSQQLISPNQS